MKSNKIPVPDGIVIEMTAALDNFRINKIMEIINEIHETGKILEDSTSIFIALPKKPNECELH